MVVDELLPLLAGRGVAAGPEDRIGLLGWSMGGYGVLHLGGLLGAERVAAVCAVSPALWTDPDDADLVTTFEPGGHDPGYRRRMLPAELAFLGEHVSLPS